MDIVELIKQIPSFENAFISTITKTDGYYEADVVENGESKTIGLWHLPPNRIQPISLHVMCAINHPNLIKVHHIHTLSNGEILAVVDRMKNQIELDFVAHPEARIRMIYGFLSALVYCQKQQFYLARIDPNDLFWQRGADLLQYRPDGIIMNDKVDHTQPEGLFEVCLAILLGLTYEEINEEDLDDTLGIGEEFAPARMLLKEIHDGIALDKLLQHDVFIPAGLINANLNPIVVIPNVEQIEVLKSKIDELYKIVKELVKDPDLHLKFFFLGVDWWYRCGQLELNSHDKVLAIVNLARQLDGSIYKPISLEQYQIIVHLKGILYRPYLYDGAKSLEQLGATYSSILLHSDIYVQVDIAKWFDQLDQGHMDKRARVKDLF